jgi:hypothetical protein
MTHSTLHSVVVDVLARYVDAPPHRPGELEQLIEALGDAMRLDVDIPSPLRRWISHHLEEPAFLGAMNARARALALVTEQIRGEGASAGLEPAVASRDRAESFTRGLRWSAFTAGQPGWLTSLQPLENAAAALSRALAKGTTRGSLIEMLQDRSALLDAASPWTDIAQEDDVGSTGKVELSGLADQSVELPDESLLAYLSLGEGRAVVEALARKEPAFRELLRQLGRGVPQGLVARRFFTQAADRVVVPLRLRHAAETRVETSTPRVVELGRAGDVDATMRLSIDRGQVTALALGPDVTGLQLGDVVGEEVAPHRWQVTVSWPVDATELDLDLEVRGRRTTFTERLRLDGRADS